MRLLCTLFSAVMILPLGLFGQPAETLQSTYLAAALSPGNEIPPVEVGGEFANGAAAVAIHAIRDHNTGEIVKAFVNFNVDYFLDEPQDLVAMHIHKGRINQNGPVVVGSGMMAIEGAGIGTITPPQLEMTSPEGLAAIKAILENPPSFYVNVHSESNPPGLMRGQLGSIEVTQLRNLTRLSDHRGARRRHSSNRAVDYGANQAASHGAWRSASR